MNNQLSTALITCLCIYLWVRGLISAYIVSIIAILLLLLAKALSASEVILVLCDPVLQLLLASLIIAKGLTESGLAQRVALGIIKSKFASRSFSNLLLALGVVSTVLSLFISNTAVTALMLPVGLMIIEAFNLRDSRQCIAILIMLAWGASMAVGIMIGSPPNLIAENTLAEQGIAKISFVTWMLFGIPINVVMLFLSWLVLRRLYACEIDRPMMLDRAYQDKIELKQEVTAKELFAAVVFFITFVLWFVPDIATGIFGYGHKYTNILSVWFSTSNVALLGAGLMLFMPYSLKSPRPILKLSSILQVDWNSMFLFFGGLLLGKAMFETGLASLIGTTVHEMTGASSQLSITALMIALAILFSELTSNTAAAAILLPFAITLAQSAGVNPVAPAIGVAMGTSFGFMMPISTPPNSIVYSSGMVPIKEMLKAGIFIDIIGFFVILIVLKLVLPLLGWW